MNLEFQSWVRLLTNIALMIPVIMATTYCIWLWWDARHLYLLFGALSLLTFVPLLFLRVAAVPEPPLLPQATLELASLIINALASLFGLAWLAGLLRERLRVSRLRHKYLDETEEQA